ncbi:response regulator [Methylopila turkensis]|uniref:Regulatory protein VirG n=1 Tax=Methylopila turkensis TaxID=1437816 RepID=A0A9W6JNK3_9HYPH|nr:response regulator transcription factor [Methylopila turkensis]GLK80925.1 DNA-binding response regulator [Methylopila turkensis]
MNMQMQTFQNCAPEAPASILIVEDDRDIAGMLAETLTQNGYAAVAAQSGAEMDRLLRRQSFDLIVLDVMLPGEDGFSICRRLRAEARTPIVMLTAVAADVDRIVGLEFGADDYVTKPFNTRELLARIKGLLRRASYGSERPGRRSAMTFAGWTVDPVARTLVDCAGAQVFMTTAEFDLLVALCQNAGQVLTREQLLSLTHAGVAGPVERSVDVHVSRIRQKIEPNPKDPSLIKTVRLGGYLFTPVVEAS